MTGHFNSHRTTDIKPEMLSGVQTGNGTPHDKYNIRGITYVRTNRKDNIFKTTSAKLYIYIGVGSRDLFIDEAHTALGIPQYFFPACCLLRFAAFFKYCVESGANPMHTHVVVKSLH